ncbi:glycosyltransferase family 4 protein [Uliginosibacterium sp. H3]|uniref:Glycosyltransferase family 4 protein n=1 Tax=Uliginosibacterium silvisoli TaxID=3114758 RepID=A0ABU6JYC0_9RHOO|nr:glycosyltransferase family 4 protein [Uliginosibacterium sp. H3]
MKDLVRAKPRLAVIEMAVGRNTPAGSCVLAEVKGLTDMFDVVVFSDVCDVAGEPGVTWIRVPLPARPNVLRYLAFHINAPLRFLLWRLSGGVADRIQATQGQLPGADVVYAHFCHAAYLKGAWAASTVTGPRRWARWVTHRWSAWFEARAVSRAEIIVVPSHGLQREMTGEYPDIASRFVCISNPVDLERFARPPDFDRHTARRALGIAEDDIVLSFMALGDFERKGLGLLIEALGGVTSEVQQSVKFVVIGGQGSEISEYQAFAESFGLAGQLIFVGMQSDVCPYLWLSDAFAFPSAYEIFSLAILQAAAAGLPVLVSARLYGAEEFVVDGVNGWVAERNVEAVRDGLLRILNDQPRFGEMAGAASNSVAQYSQEAFQSRWRAFYAGASSRLAVPAANSKRARVQR